MRISLLGINFAPEHTGIGPYTTQIASRLALRHEVTVFTGLPHYPGWVVPPDWKRALRRDSRANGMRVLHHRHYVPAQQDVARRTFYEASWSLNSARAALSTPADAVVAVIPALLGAVLAHAVGRRFNAPVGLIVQDVMSTAAAQSGILGGSGVAKTAARLEGRALRAADSVVTIHPRLGTELRNRFALAAPPEVIYNWSHIGSADATDVVKARRRLGWAEDDLVVLHSGNMGLKQDLDNVVTAGRIAAGDGGTPVRFVLAGGGNQQAHLEALAAQLPNVDVIDGVPDAEFPALLAAADILLVNERPGMRSMSLPSKLTSYFTSGRPVVAATEHDSATAAFLRAADASVTVPAGDPTALLGAVRSLVSDRELAARLGGNGRRFAERHLREDAALAAYDAWVDALAARSRPRVRR